MLGLDGETEKLVVVEVAGDSLVIRRAGAPAPTASEVVRAAERVAVTPGRASAVATGAHEAPDGYAPLGPVHPYPDSPRTRSHA